MGQRIDVNHENIYYGDFLAVEDVNINIEPNKVTSFIGPSGCGKVHRAAHLGPYARDHPWRSRRGRGAARRQEPVRQGRGSGGRAPRRRHGLPATEPVPTMSIRENVLAGVRMTTTTWPSPTPTIWSSGLCAVPTSGKRSRTVLTTLASACPVASSSVCASPAPWPSTRRCCSWMSPAPPWTRFRPWLSRI